MDTQNQALAAAPGLPPALMVKAFPFFLAWDDQLRLTASGPSLRRLCAAAVPGAPLTDLVRLQRPAGQLSAEFFRSSDELPLLLELIGSGTLLRGQVISLTDPECFLLLATPWFSDPAEMKQQGLTESDFALHDPTLDWLATIQTQQAANAELQQLTALLTEQRTKLHEQEEESSKLALEQSATR